MVADSPVLALSGGVGGAKLCLGLSDLLADGELKVVVNTADDFEHLGLLVCPDIDTLLYTLSRRNNRELGWGLAGETWQAMDALAALGGETWFRLGDRDLATHLWRRDAISRGLDLLQLTTELAAAMGIESEILPMSAQPVRTQVHSPEGDLPFQHYFVKHQCQPAVTGFSFVGLEAAVPNPRLMQLLQHGAPRAIVICPSNPFVSIDPILQLPGLWPALRDCPAPVIAVSPIVAGMAIKGPAAKMMAELGMPVTAEAVAAHYRVSYPGLIDCFVIDESDATLAPSIEEQGMATAVAATVMHNDDDKRALAAEVLRLAAGS
jgi:LPPG:FO 2-phospho-L-lactate transferase